MFASSSEHNEERKSRYGGGPHGLGKYTKHKSRNYCFTIYN